MDSFKSIDEINLQYPDWQQAELHSKSLLVGRPLSNNHVLNEKPSLCNCCGNEIQKQYIPLCENTKQLEFLGVGFPLYYTFLKYCIILLILETISSSTLNLIDDMNENYDFCIKNIPKVVPNDGKEVECTSISVYFADLEDHLLRNTIVLRISYFTTAILFYTYMRDSLRKLIHYYDERSTTYSDYTLLMKHLPSKTGIKEDLRELLSGFKVREITVIGAFDHIQKMEQGLKSMQSIKSKRIEAIKKKNITLDEAQIFLRELQYLNKDIADAQRRLYQGIKQQQKLYQIDQIIPIRAIICVETDQQKERIIKMLHQKQHQHVPQGWIESDISSLNISEAPEPKQIIWQNLNLPMKQKLKSYAIGWAVTFLLLLIITIVFYFIMNWLTTSIQQSAQHGLDKARILFYSLLIVVVMINKFIISPLLHQICHYEKYFTKSKQEFGFTLKYLLSMFFTTAMMTVFVDVLTKNNIYSQSFGVVQGQTAMILINSFLIPLIWLINPWTICLKIKRWYYRSKAGVTQDQANNMMQCLPYQLGKRFAEIIKLMWLVSLYQSLIPIGTIIAIFGLTLYYWIDKYNLLRRSSVKQSISGILTMRVMVLLQFSLILKQSGELFFDVWIRYEYDISTVICLVLAIVYFFLPKNRILQCLHHQKFHKEEKMLSESRTQLGVGYDELHPITGTKMKNLVESISRKMRKPTDYLYQYKSIISKASIEENVYSNRILKTFKRQIRQRQMRQAFHQSNKVQLLKQNLDNTHL